jgi:hypothetical protein
MMAMACPAMPEVLAEEKSNGLFTLTDGHGLAVGWQFRSEANGGPAFVVVRRSRFGFQAVEESFPLTAEGWAAAWQALVARYPRGVEPTLAALRSRAAAVAPVSQAKVGRSGTTYTFHSMRGFHQFSAIVVGVVFGAGLFVSTAVAVADPHSKWAQGISTSGAIWSTALSLVFIWLGIRLFRVGVYISSGKMTIRGYVVSRTIKASQIQAIALQPNDNGHNLRWIPRVELTSGKSFWIDSFDCGSAEKPPKPELAAAIEEVRTLLGAKTPNPQ